MPKGKQTCKILKEIRKQIAAENDIELVISECTYQGDCTGTCPKCEAEVRYLEQKLEKRQRLGKTVMISGLAVSTMLGAVSCHNTSKTPLQGDVARPVDATIVEDPVILDEPIRLQGEPVEMPADILPADWEEPDKVKEEPMPLIGEIEVDVENETSDLCYVVEQMPEFPGGYEKLPEYLQNNVVYPQEAKDARIEGRVFVTFIIEADGSVSNVKVLRGIGYGCDEEAVRVVESMPKWEPGYQKGVAVRVQSNLPIPFQMSDTLKN